MLFLKNIMRTDLKGTLQSEMFFCQFNFKTIQYSELGYTIYCSTTNSMQRSGKLFIIRHFLPLCRNYFSAFSDDADVFFPFLSTMLEFFWRIYLLRKNSCLRILRTRMYSQRFAFIPISTGLLPPPPLCWAESKSINYFNNV